MNWWIYTTTGAHSFEDEKAIRRSAVHLSRSLHHHPERSRAAAEAIASRQRDRSASGACRKFIKKGRGHTHDGHAAISRVRNPHYVRNHRRPPSSRPPHPGGKSSMPASRTMGTATGSWSPIKPYPLQSGEGIETVLSNEDQFTVIQHVVNVLASPRHMRPVHLYRQGRLSFVPEGPTPSGSVAYRQVLAGLFAPQKPTALPH